ncbi:hypothetical protein JRO89_XSUnG0027400 [Xanthoceras sorbifolium]|uniref:serine O-acetyltransferase n=1 Tax=Xanthoceras sorbifolium TaxID=99658 RepID=A0ABQ8H087_9ROSI|nr:hypothetical protein JRO89_XSUnG0027400 [Xanthoceras sorbifolium]
MAACVDNSGAETANKRFCSLESKQCLTTSTSFCREEAQSDVKQEPILLNYYCFSVLSHSSIESALANHLAMKLSNPSLSSDTLSQLFLSIFNEDHGIRRAIRDDLKAIRQRDPACISYVHCLLNFKGFLACQAHRVAHKLWSQGRTAMALLIQSRISEVFAVDIHPGARIGWGILIDHATGVVIGETAVIGDNVTILHNVTVGGTGKVSGDRHPKIGDAVFLGAGTKVLGNIRIGAEAKIGAGSVVLKEVPPRSTAVGNPARLLLLGDKERDQFSIESALANHLAMKLSNPSLLSDTLSQLFLSIFNEDHGIRRDIRDDLKAIRERDPACISYVHCLLNFKGFLACQAHRVAHKLWSQGRTAMALLIQSRVSKVFAVDICVSTSVGSIKLEKKRRKESQQSFRC